MPTVTQTSAPVSRPPVLAPVAVPAPGKKPGLPSGVKWLIFLLILVIVGGLGYWGYRRLEARRAQATTVVMKTATITRGTLENRLRINGLTSARNFANIIAPRLRGAGDRELNLLSAATSGTFVKKGQIVAELDPQRIRDNLDDEMAQLKEAENAIRKRAAEQLLDMTNLEQQLRLAQADVDKANLDLKTHEIRTDIDRELIQLSIDEAHASYKEIQADVPQTKASQRADLRYLEITRDMQQMRVNRSRSDLQRLTIRAPMDGMAVMQTLFQPGGEQRQIQVGDRVQPGQPFMKIIDQSSMQVEASINQAESSQFRIGQEAVIGLDAFPDARYTGKIFSVAALATGGMRQQYFIRNIPIRVDIRKPDNRVIPDLSAYADVLLGKVENAILVPASAVTTEGRQAYVRVKAGNTFEKRAVRVGMSDGTRFVVLEGLREGEVVQVSG